MQLRTKPRSGAQRQRNQVRFRFVQFADLSAIVRARRVEIAQAGKAETIGAVIGLERLLKKQLRHAVRVHRLARRVFLDRNFGGLAVYRARRGKYDPLHSRIQRCIQQRETTLDIVMKIFFGSATDSPT